MIICALCFDHIHLFIAISVYFHSLCLVILSSPYLCHLFLSLPQLAFCSLLTAATCFLISTSPLCHQSTSHYLTPSPSVTPCWILLLTSKTQFPFVPAPRSQCSRSYIASSCLIFLSLEGCSPLFVCLSVPINTLNHDNSYQVPPVFKFATGIQVRGDEIVRSK